MMKNERLLLHSCRSVLSVLERGEGGDVEVEHDASKSRNTIRATKLRFVADAERARRDAARSAEDRAFLNKPSSFTGNSALAMAA